MKIFMLQNYSVWYAEFMKKKSLLNTNRYLQNKEEREKRLLRNVISSSKIEGITVPIDRIIQPGQSVNIKKSSPKQS